MTNISRNLPMITDENGIDMDTNETDKTWENESTRDTTPMVKYL